MIAPSQSYLNLKHVLHTMAQLASAEYETLRKTIYERLGLILTADILGMAKDDLAAAKKHVMMNFIHNMKTYSVKLTHI